MSAQESAKEQTTVAAGRKAPYTTVPDWVILHPDLDPQAKALYAVLAMHVNVSREDGVAWPAQLSQAKILGYSRRQSVVPYITQLERVGAITTETWTRPEGTKGIRYYVHQTPPPGFTGDHTVAEYYKRVDGAKVQEDAPVPTLARLRTSVTATPAAKDAPSTPTPAKKAAAKKATAKAPAKRAAAKERTEEEIKLDKRANAGANLWWEEAKERVEQKRMTKLIGTAKQRSSKFLALRGLIRGALEVYTAEQILAALRELNVWIPSVPQFDVALGRQDGVAPAARPGARAPIFKNEQWQNPAPGEGGHEAPAGPDASVFGVRIDSDDDEPNGVLMPDVFGVTFDDDAA
ncbi:hypothetical protein ABT024_05335 [Streptomyces sp. NPDC002812]|uniref:hypothetical protein n=1 Tax=Streptomyces sp. NPDC002812 TaxID=3154434 RepID=UPI00331A2013